MLEDLAQRWADGCVWAHPDQSYTEYSSYGQNIHAVTDLKNDKAEEWAQGWYEEKNKYTYSAFGQLPGVGHYTQVSLVIKD